MSKRKYDFAGWVTKNDVRCMDGVTIKHDAFKSNDGKKVPLVWNHDHKSPTNILGHIELKNQPNGVYGYGYFNNSVEAQNAKGLLEHGDITSMSIGARKIKRNGSDVVHGVIYEVSLVLAGANPKALIESVITHSDEGEDTESGIIYTGTLIHSADDIIEEPEKKENEMEDNDKTIADVIADMTEEQQDAVYGLLGSVVEAYEEDITDEEEGDEDLKQNIFSMGTEDQDNNDELRHSATEALQEAINSGASSLKQVLESRFDEEELEHGVNSIDMLFPEARPSNGQAPIVYKDPNTDYKKILNKTHKSPFAKVKTLVADLTEDEARAKGYIKGNMKKEQFFSLIKRETGPTTVYKKQKIDRDDVIDITDFSIVDFMKAEMREMLEEEIARAILVGDGREVDDEDKINEQNIRPIVTDHEFFTIQKQYTNAEDFVEAVILAMAEFRGTGTPDMFIDSTLLAQIKLLKGTDNRYLFGNIPSTAAIATMLGVGEIIPTSFMKDKGALLVNLKDYRVGAAKGGEITNFDDFDIDFNQYKYLNETRLSGALTMPKSAIHMNTAVITGADDTEGGMKFGKRQADKVEGEED